jgi:hypothetical protein
MVPMVHSSAAPSGEFGAATAAEFAITLKGWRSQLRWAMTQREEDPARVWLEVISIDERSKRALATATDPTQLAEVHRFRDKLESSIASLTQELGDDNVAPLYAWLDLVRERRKIVMRIEDAEAAVSQTRALRLPDGATSPTTEEEAVEQLARAQGDLQQWTAACPPAPPPQVMAIWEAEGGDDLRATRSTEAMAVGRKGDEARQLLAGAAGRTPGKHPWHGSRAELISIPVAGAVALLFLIFALAMGSGTLAALGVVALLAAGGLVGWSARVRQLEKAEHAAALDWVWHAAMYEERRSLAELEHGWLRALVDGLRALKSFDAKAGTGGQLREFEDGRPDLVDMVHEVARDLEGRP